MIRAENLSKHFEKFVALEHVTCTIDDGCIYGMVGSNRRFFARYPAFTSRTEALFLLMSNQFGTIRR